MPSGGPSLQVQSRWPQAVPGLGPHSGRPPGACSKESQQSWVKMEMCSDAELRLGLRQTCAAPDHSLRGADQGPAEVSLHSPPAAVNAGKSLPPQPPRQMPCVNQARRLLGICRLPRVTGPRSTTHNGQQGAPPPGYRSTPTPAARFPTCHMAPGAWVHNSTKTASSYSARRYLAFPRIEHPLNAATQERLEKLGDTREGH